MLNENTFKLFKFIYSFLDGDQGNYFRSISYIRTWNFKIKISLFTKTQIINWFYWVKGFINNRIEKASIQSRIESFVKKEYASVGYAP